MICNHLTRMQSNAIYVEAMVDKDAETLRRLCLEDLNFLLVVALKRKDANQDWIYDRIRDVERSPDGMLDLWAREHYKSTIITFALTIQDILRDPETIVGIFSHTRPIAKGFLTQIKTELEDNEFLKSYFPDVLYQSPKTEAPRWSLDNGIVVKRTSNPKEATVEAHGLVDGQPTSKHFRVLVYDDVVTRESVSTPDMIKKVTDAWALSLNLGAHGGKRRYIGTRYHYNDTYRAIMERQAAHPRIHPATHDGTSQGKPVYLTPEQLSEKRREMGPYVFGCQMLQNPTEDSAMGFKEEWLKHYDYLHGTRGWNIYIIVDPAGEKKKVNDYTVILVIGLAPDGNFYLLDGIRDRLNLTERTKALFRLHRKWKPLKTGYEKYGIQSDIEHIEYVQEQENYRFNIIPLGGSLAKNDRIRALVPLFECGRFFIPWTLMYTDYEGIVKDFIPQFIEDEFKAFPVAIHDDMLDCMARITDSKLGAVHPEEQPYVHSIANQAKALVNMAATEFDVLRY